MICGGRGERCKINRAAQRRSHNLFIALMTKPARRAFVWRVPCFARLPNGGNPARILDTLRRTGDAMTTLTKKIAELAMSLPAAVVAK